MNYTIQMKKKEVIYECIINIVSCVFMIILGMIARIKGFISPEQKEGANHIVFNVLFPILILNVLFTAKIESSAILIVVYVLIAFTLALVLGKCITKFTGKEVGHISPYLLTTCEGGNVALPLYTSIVGVAYASNTVIFDIAGTVIAFIIIPVLVAKVTSGNTSTKELLKTIFTNSFVIALMLGIILNLLGVYDLLSQTAFIDLYTNTIQQATAPIVSLILLIIGYNLKINKDTLGSLLKLVGVRIIFYIFVIAGFFVFFPHLMADKIYMMAVLIYFMCPTGFAMPMLISPLNKSEEDEDFTAAFISLFMVITLIVYTCVVLFIA